jgi:hypothetical protein
MSGYSGQVILIAGAIGAVAIGVAETFRTQGAIVLIAPGESCPPDVIAGCLGFEFIHGAVIHPTDLTLRCEQVTKKHAKLDLVICCTGDYPPAYPNEIPPSFRPTRAIRFRQRLGEMAAAIL